MSVKHTVSLVFEPLHVGTRLDRRAWPPHVTVVGNFGVTAPTKLLVRALCAAAAWGEPVPITLGDHGMFGTHHDVPVRLVSSPRLGQLHRTLAGAVSALDGFAADAPDHWGEGYRPHLTLTDDELPDPLIAVSAVLAALEGPSARIVAAFALPAPPDARSTVTV